MKLTPKHWSWNQPFPQGVWLENPAGNIPVVWLVTLTDNTAALSVLRAVLSPEELARLERFQLAEDKLRFLIGRGLLRLLIGASAQLAANEVKLTQNAYGKPAWISPHGCQPLHFNVSHSGQLVVLAFHAHCEVGVDVEEVRPEPDLEITARQMFSAEEYNHWAALNSEQRPDVFYQLWTRREATVKAIGKGFSGVNVSLSDERLTCYELELPAGYQGAVACRH